MNEHYKGGVSFSRSRNLTNAFFSSRYGDDLNPWGDLIAAARAWCTMRVGGKAIIGIPTGPDIVSYNSHKIYGPVLYSHLFANWKQVYTETDMNQYDETCNYCYQPLHVIEKV